jgi:hypothetical protein
MVKIRKKKRREEESRDGSVEGNEEGEQHEA